MEKSSKKILIGAGVIAGLALIYFALSYPFKPNIGTMVAGTTGGGTTCPQGEIKCKSSDKCYNPNAQYIVDPCAAGAAGIV